MEDDIDIEEHDVLDNPRIRTIFPDIAQIKAEIPDDDYDDPDQEMDYQSYSTDEHPPNQGEEESSEYSRFGNKIILGSRPSNSILESVLTFGRQHPEVKQEVEEYDGPAEEESHEDHYNQPTPVLILGSKPSSSGVITPFSVNDVSRKDRENLNTISFLGHEIDLNEVNAHENGVAQEVDNDKEPRDPSAAFVLVENWGPHLENSSCYCKECQILFPTSNTLLAHNMTAHSFLVALDKNKAVKSTSKVNAKEVETGKLCNHCNKMFPDSDSLINHLYMTFDKNSLLKNQPKKVVANPFNKQVSANIVKSQKRDVPKSSKPSSQVQVYAQGATDLFRCEVCGYYSEMYWSFVKHMRRNHAKKTFNEEKEVFDGTCPHCSNVLKSKMIYNRHIQYVHKAVFNLNVGDSDGLLYRCNICSCYFGTEWAFIRHMKRSHGKNLNKDTAQKCAYDANCPHCSAVFKSKSRYNKHVYRTHSALFKSKGHIDKTPTPKKIPVIREPIDVKNKAVPPKFNRNNGKYQCMVCREIFLSYVRARKHRRLKHPELKQLNLFQLIDSQNAKAPSKIVLKYPKSSNIDKKVPVTKMLDVLPSTSKSPQKINHPDVIPKPLNQIVIPKSVIFKCNKCEIHFTSCTATIFHSKSCGKDNDDWKCNVCNRLFQKFDQTVHKRQHQVTEKFNVVVFHENIYGRVLNRCPNCNLYFHEKEFYLHDQNKYCKGTGVKCEKCFTSIHVTSVETHNEWHERIRNIKKNMVLVEFSSISVEQTQLTPVKRVLDMDNEISLLPTKKPKIEETHISKKKVVTYCRKCGIYMFNSTHAAMHASGKCDRFTETDKKICKICGLTYTKESHMIYHKTYPNLTLMDMMFRSVEDNKITAPPIPNFPGCNKCKVHFCKKEAVITHNCKDSYKTCKLCKKRYSDLAYKLHMRFHEYHEKFEATSFESSSPNMQLVPKKIPADPMPELLKKYELLTNTWNILFSCSSCDIVSDSYDRVIEHCQNHFNNMESYDVMIQFCQICELKFDGSCFERHKALHAQNECVNKDSFTVCSYYYRQLLSQKWLKAFYRVIPETQMQQILAKSIYTSSGRRIKLRVTKEGPPENAIFKCGQCALFVHPQAVSGHYKNVSCNKDYSLKNNCRYCGITLSTMSAKIHHEKCHKTTDSFNVVHFNENGDREFNKKLIDCDSRIRRGLFELKAGKGFHFYRCENCKCCMVRKGNILLHKCPKPSLILQCNICQLHIYSSLFNKHLKLHKLNPKLIPKNIKCTGFKKGPRGDVTLVGGTEKTIIKLYKCHCGLHFTSTKAIDKHNEVCGVNDDIIKEKCSKCHRLFDTNQLVAHLCKHHSKDNDENTEFEVTVVSPGDRTTTQATMAKAEINGNISEKGKQLFKCQKCNVYYLSHGGLQYHYDTKHQVGKVIKCQFCKLQFMPKTLVKHITIQHKILKCKSSDFIINVGYLHSTGTLRVKKSVKSAIRGPYKKIKTVRGPYKKIETNRSSGIVITDFHRRVDINLYSNKLYKCNVCNVHFLTLHSLKSHKNRNNHNFELIECSDCGYGFTITSLPKHSYIHHEAMNLKSEDFKIKYGTKDDDSTDDENDKDDLSPDENSNEDNNAYTVTTNDRLQKSANNEEKKMGIKDGQTKTYKYTSILYECGICNIVSFKNNESHIKNHLTNAVMPARHTCSCGLNFSVTTIAKHENLHHGIQNLNRDDLYTVKMNVHDGIVGSNHLFRCEICLMNFSTMKNLENHLDVVVHSTSSKECPQCGLLFSLSGLAQHVKLHHKAMKLRPEDYVVLQSVGNSEVEVVDHLAKNNDFAQTESMKSGIVQDRRLYKCSLCATYYLNSNDMSGCKHEAAPTAICDKCDLKFCEDALKTHNETHHTNIDLNKEDYEVIESRELLEDELVSNNSVEVENTDNEILDDSETNIYNKNEATLFKCNSCKRHYLHKKTLKSHFLNSNPQCHRNLAIETCEYCGLYFSSLTLKTHVRQHTVHKLTLKDFRVIDQVEAGLANYVCRYPTNKDDTESENVTPMETTQDKETFDETDVLENKITVQVKSKLYQCDKCDCCFLTLTNAKDHYGVCQYVQTYVKCEQCQLKFHKSLNMHMKLHHETQNFDVKDLVIVRYKPENFTEYVGSSTPVKLIETLEAVSTLNKKLYTNMLFKCGTCSLHFLLKESLELHTENPELILLKSTCTFCGLAFSVNTLPTHVYIHHENMKLTTANFCITVKDEVMEGNDSINSESVILENSQKILPISNNHNLSNGENDAATNDGQGLNAKVIESKNSTSSPKSLNVESSTASENCLNEDVTHKPLIIESCGDQNGAALQTPSPKTNAAKDTEISKTVKLYKCAVCNVCFLTQATCYKHTVNHIALDPKDYIECKLCGYQFLILNNCLHKHITKHHKSQFKPEEVLIEEYHPDILCHGTPKIDIYFGTDKLQSKLISTTSDAIVKSECLEISEAEMTMVDNSSLDLDTNKSTEVVANNGEGSIKPTDQRKIVDMEVDSNIANVSNATDLNYSSNSGIANDLDTVSIDLTDKCANSSDNSVIDLDSFKSSEVVCVESIDEGSKTADLGPFKSSEVVSVEITDEDSKTACEIINLDEIPDTVDSDDTNIKTVSTC